jgi:5-amino-6-(5-phosphoribosylamino)uracil reductase
MSIDGYIDDATPERLLLSNDEDFDRVDSVRASADAILVGMNTIRRDNPRLLVRSYDRVRDRVSRGMPPQPIKVTMTTSGSLDPDRMFFTAGDTLKVVYCPRAMEAHLQALLGDRATVVGVADPVNLNFVMADLTGRGVHRLMVEGGTTIHTQFLTGGLVDELHLSLCPFFVGEVDGPRFVGPGEFPWNKDHRMALAEARPIGNVVLLRYLLNHS